MWVLVSWACHRVIAKKAQFKSQLMRNFIFNDLEVIVAIYPYNRIIGFYA